MGPTAQHFGVPQELHQAPAFLSLTIRFGLMLNAFMLMQSLLMLLDSRHHVIADHRKKGQ